MAAATIAPLPMFGAWNEHYSNHPAGLPISRYKPNTNPNTGAAAVDSMWAKYQAAQAGQAPAPTTPAPAASTGTAWNGWTQDFTGPAPTAASATAPGPTAPATGTGATPTDFASQYTPAMMDQIYENPWYIINDVFSGAKGTSPLYQALRDIGADPLSLFNIIKGSQDGTKPGGAADFTNWLAGTYKEQGTAGGQRFNAQDLLGKLFGQQKFGAESKNTLGQILGAGDMSTQVRTLYNLARDASNIGMNPLAARGYQSALAQAGDRYGEAALSSGGTDPIKNPSAWIAENMPWLTLGGN